MTCDMNFLFYFIYMFIYYYYFLIFPTSFGICLNSFVLIGRSVGRFWECFILGCSECLDKLQCLSFSWKRFCFLNLFGNWEDLILFLCFIFCTEDLFSMWDSLFYHLDFFCFFFFLFVLMHSCTWGILYIET